MFSVGDNAIVTQKIERIDGMSVVYPGEKVKITKVFQGKDYTIVDIQPHNGMLPMIDVCCNYEGPLKKCDMV